MEDIKKEIYEQDAIDEKIAIATQAQMEAQGMKKCKICDCWVYEEDLTNGICQSCIDDIISGTTAEEVIEYAEKNDDLFVLLTQYLFSEEEVIDELEEMAVEGDRTDHSWFERNIKEYIDNDVSHYLDYLEAKGEL